MRSHSWTCSHGCKLFCGNWDFHKRFRCKPLIVNKHMDALLHMESVNSPQNVRGLRRLFDNVSCHVRSLEALGVDSATYGGLLSPVLFSKLPQDLQLMISHKYPMRTGTFTH